MTQVYEASLELGLKTNKNRSIYIYSHNGGNFDLPIILEHLNRIHKSNVGYMPTIIANRENDVYQLSIKFLTTTFVFRDSMKIFPMSLKDLSLNMLGENQVKMNINHDALRTLMLTCLEDPSSIYV